MNKSKKIIALTLAIALSTAVFIGCSDKKTPSDDANASVGKVVKLTAVFPGGESNAGSQVTAAVNEKLKADGLNIDITIKYIDDYWNKLALEVAGGTAYDLAWAHSSTLSDLVAKKVYQPIDEALAANGKELIENTPEYVLKGGKVSDKQYALPRSIPTTAFNNVFNIRKDLREKYNLPVINDIAGLEAYFEAIVKDDPTMLPIAGSNMQPMFPIYADYFFPIGDGGTNPIYIDPADPTHTVKSFWDSDAFTQIATKRKEWKDKGWLNNAQASSLESEDAGFNYGKVGCVASNIMSVSERIDNMMATTVGAIPETVFLKPQTSRIYLAGDNMLAVPSTSKNVKEAVALVNWIKKDQANYDLWSYGVEGTNYKLVDNAIDVSEIEESNQFNTNVWMWNDIRLARFSANFPKEDIDGLKKWDENSEVTPYVGFIMDTSKVKTQVSQVTAVMNEYSLNLGLGVHDINEIRDEIMKKLNAAGLQDIINECQTQINDWVK